MVEAHVPVAAAYVCSNSPPTVKYTLLLVQYISYVLTVVPGLNVAPRLPLKLPLATLTAPIVPPHISSENAVPASWKHAPVPAANQADVTVAE